jgi:hypothetical protein
LLNNAYGEVLVNPFEFDFDFDHWSALARRDPAAFFLAREQVISEFIAAAPSDQTVQLVEFQRLIDGSRAQAGTPLKAVRQMMGMIGDQLEALQAQMQRLSDESVALAGELTKSHN